MWSTIHDNHTSRHYQYGEIAFRSYVRHVRVSVHLDTWQNTWFIAFHDSWWRNPKDLLPSLASSCYIRWNTPCCVVAAGYNSPRCYHRRESFSTIYSTLASTIHSTLASGSYPKIDFSLANALWMTCSFFFNKIIPSFRQWRNKCL